MAETRSYTVRLLLDIIKQHTITKSARIAQGFRVTYSLGIHRTISCAYTYFPKWETPAPDLPTRLQNQTLQNLHPRLLTFRPPPKLSSTSVPDELSHEKSREWEHGRSIRRHQASHTTYWRKAEAELNDSLPQYMTSVSVEWFEEDVEVHFVYRARRVEKGRGVPLLFLHGSFLTQGDENQPTFDVVAPSLPIFERLRTLPIRGIHACPNDQAEIHRITVRRFPPSECLLLEHATKQNPCILNFIPSPAPYPWRNPILFPQAVLGIRYVPATLGDALNDSPVGLLACTVGDYPWADEILRWERLGIWCERRGLRKGRHFAAWEKPEDLRDIMSKEREAYGVVAGKNGF
ncbi:hypothetical protein PMAA_093930 [Talaromyces marneffei ATCC 18224]|uniref:Epoxide hydrolase N-terminal domain-containing protein n=1 Tax=Talaromyces marneffei (strain ATCC 18224 / CBS 334.59 / QM 7333) TaxID=441960 RepID=B6QHD4_TALMQ|nr:hypothetical protein PMAA_093930 [Talaromyces marneffei ATCC 18224]EEA22780.1 hypothetical protein PMAA_093930 [Talaromyces marneffei ATCC 18224]